ncbi:MAG: hypothetical protein JRF33_21765 [Deltaproteobacteria bacterium]|nr:hypothetical protein [Deltaproteobacteria bacterium]
MKLKITGLIALGCFLFAGLASAREVTILVAGKKTPAYANAKKMADGKSIFAERKLHKAMTRIEEVIKAEEKCPMPRDIRLKWPKCNLSADQRNLVINVKVAHGDYKGKGGRGNFGLQQVIAPDATVRLLGGYDDNFKKRAPFDTPTTITLGGTIFKIMGKKHMLKEFYISGFVMDIGDGNKYDAKTNCILKGESATVQHIHLGYLNTRRLVYADNVFINSSHKAAAPLIRARDGKAEVVIRNNFILNNILAWEADSARFKTIPAVYTFEGNSFIMNWPYNPDPTTANPAALQLGGKYAASKFVVKSNLFAFNMGGAIYWTSPGEKMGPPTEIKNNLFFSNGALFGEAEPGAAAVVTKFGGFKSKDIPWNTISVEILEDDYDWDSDGNVVMDPKVPITTIKAGFANSGSVRANQTRMNDVRGMLGMNKQGGKVKISNYAPRMGVDLKVLPFPAEPKAKKYGVNRDRVEQF